MILYGGFPDNLQGKKYIKDKPNINLQNLFLSL